MKGLAALLRDNDQLAVTTLSILIESSGRLDLKASGALAMKGSDTSEH